MTPQVPDRFFWNGEEYHIVESWGEGHLSAANFGLFGLGDTSCRRGWVTTYEIMDEKLYAIETFPRVEQVPTSKLIPFTGEIWLGKDIIMKPCEGAIGYRNLYEFGLWDGSVQYCRDLSGENAEMRRRFLETGDITFARWLLGRIGCQLGPSGLNDLSGGGILGSGVPT